jgi:hypothetical protein
VKKVRGDTSAASAMSATVVASNPRSANSRRAASIRAWRVRAFLRSRSEIGLVHMASS